MQRIRLVYTKSEALQYTGNLDMQKVWERTFRRAGIAVAYTKGFHPQPRIHLACPLPLGFTSTCEYLDFWTEDEPGIEVIQKAFANSLHPGISIGSYEVIPLSSPSLQTLVQSSVYRVSVIVNLPTMEIKSRISNLLAKPDCIRERRGKRYDLLPLIENLSLLEKDPLVIEIQLATRPGATGRPEEVLDELAIPLKSVSIERSSLIFS